jgi:hypothetical protein
MAQSTWMLLDQQRPYRMQAEDALLRQALGGNGPRVGAHLRHRRRAPPGAARVPQDLHALVETGISRWKRVIGDGLRSQSDGRQATEMSIAGDVPNRMLGLGRLEYVRGA